jgi:secreted trypsin-like serine protease
MASGALELCVFVLVHALVVQAQWAIEDDGCRTPDRGVGTCISIQSCKPMMDVLEVVPQPLPPKIVNLLKSYQCGYSGTDPKVCCPKTPIKIDGVTSMKHGALPQPPDVSKHRNLNLLPQECGHLDTGDRIINGNKTGLFEFPWMALLSYRTNRGPDFKCGASILNNRYILTAAHCISHLKFSLLGVRVGEHNIKTRIDCEIKDGEQICAPPFKDLSIEEIIPHPNYNAKAFTNDIGLLRVSSMDLTQENVKPVCLPLGKTRNYNFTGRNCVVTGWGATETGRSSIELLQVQIPAVPQEECVEIYKNLTSVTHRQMCAGGKTKSDSCAGDSGGPLHVVAYLNEDTRLVQQGVVSFGPRDCGKEGIPGVYTRVAYYMDWILDNMKP